MEPWLSLIQSLSLKDVYFKDLVSADLSTIPWDIFASMRDPLLLHCKPSQLGLLIQSLVSAGAGPNTPCMAFAETPQKESSISGELGNIALKSKKLSGKSLYLLIASELPETPELLPLSGKTVLITRARSQAMDLAQLLKREGATIYDIPSIQIILRDQSIQELAKELDSIDTYSWLILTSVNTVSALQDLLTSRNQDWSIFHHLKIACIGKSTARKVEEFGGVVELVPRQFQAEGLVELLLQSDLRGKKILLPRAANSRELLPQTLRKEGADVCEINIYRAELPESSRKELIELLQTTHLDFVTFTSSSTVRNFMEMAGELLLSKSPFTKIACIGPITAGTLREYGIEPDVVAEEFTMQGLVQAMVDSIMPGNS